MYVSAKVMPVGTTSRIREEGIRENGRGDESLYDIFETL
jgi:hypothetical protein